MFNKSQIAKDQKKAKQPKSLARPKDVDYVSKMGYRDDSPFNKRPYIDINTPTGIIDMSGTGTPLMANGVYLPPYSGQHQFNTTKVREVPVAKDGGTDIYYPPKHNPANSFAVTDPRSMSSGGSYVENQITHFQSGGNMDPGNNALELHMFYDKDVYKKQDGGIILELTDDEIEEYKKGGYVVEDISVPALQDGGKASRQVKRDQRKAARNFEYNPEAEFSMFTQPGEEELPAYEYPGRTVAIDPIEVKPIEITDRETPELDTTEMAEYYANRAKEAREEKRQSLKNTDNITYKKLSRPAGEIVLKDEMNDDMSKALTNAGYYVNQLESGDYEVIANKDIADLIYKKGITANELSTKFNLGDSKTLQQHFQPVYNSAQSIHAKRNVGKINELINQGYTKDQAIKELAKQGEGTVSGLSNLYGNYAEATYQKNKAEADALTALGVTNIKDLTEYQKKQLLNVAAGKANAEAKLDKAQADADFLRTYMPEVSDNTAYRGFMGVDASGQPMYGTTAYDKAQNEIAATRAMTDEFKYREGAQAEAAKAILTSPNLTDEQREQLLTNPDKFNEIYQSYVNWMVAPQGDPNYGPGNDPLERMKYYGDAYTRFIPGSSKSDFTITSEGKPSWQEGQYEQTVTIDGPVQMVYPEAYLMGPGAGIAGGALRGMGKVLAYSPVASAPWLNLGTALEADMAYQAFKDEGYVDQAIDAFEQGNYLEGTAKAAMGALGTIGPLRMVAGMNARTNAALELLKSDANFAETFTSNLAKTEGAADITGASKMLTAAEEAVLPVSGASKETSLLTNVSDAGALDDVAKYEKELTEFGSQYHLGNLKNSIPSSNPEFIQRGLANKEAIDDLLNTGIVRNRLSAGLPSKGRWKENVYWAEEGDPLAYNNYIVIAKNSEGLANRPVTAADIVDIKVLQADGTYSSLPNWQNMINKPEILKGSNLGNASTEAAVTSEAAIAGQVPQASFDAGTGTTVGTGVRDFTNDYLFNFNNQALTSVAPEELFTTIASNPGAEIVDVMDATLPEGYGLNTAGVIAAQEEAFNLGTNVADRWAFTDKEKYFGIRAEADDILKNEIPKLTTEKEALINKRELLNQTLVDEFMQSKGLLEKYKADPFTRDISQETFVEYLKYAESNPQMIKLNEELKMIDDAIANTNAKANAKMLEGEQYVDPIFKQKVQDMYTAAGKTMPENINMPKSDARLVQLNEADPSFKALSKEAQEFLKANPTKGVQIPGTGETITLGSTAEKDARYYLSETPQGEKEILRVVNQNFKDPLGVQGTAAHEQRHVVQKAYDWLSLVNKYNPEYNYYTTNAENELAKEFNKWMVNPKLAGDPEAYTYSQGYTYDTWLSGVGELDAQLMKARTDVVKDWMQKYGFSMDEAVQMVKEQELAGDNNLYELYLNNPSAELNYHFKADTPFDIKKKLLQVLPAATVIVGSGAALGAAAGSSGQSQQKRGGTIPRLNKFSKSYYEDELTDAEIKALREQGIRVEEV